MTPARWINWLPFLILFPFFPLFIFTVLRRIAVPFELEWNEGQSAEQALRFAQGLALYPAPETGWVPYMYAPLHHMIYGWLMYLMDERSLALGRFVSFGGTMLLLFASERLVYRETRRRAVSLLAPLLILAYYRPGGFWYDLARVDMLAMGLFLGGLLLVTDQTPRWRRALGGFLLLALACFTKQSLAIPAAGAALLLLIRSPQIALTAGPLAAWLAIAGAATFATQGNTHAWHYIITNASQHPTVPDALVSENLQRAWGNGPRALLSHVTSQVPGPTAGLWWEFGRHLIALFFFAVAALAFALPSSRPRTLRGARLLLPLVLLTASGIIGYAKFGGYRNNLIAGFIAISILTPLAFAWMQRALPRRWNAIAPTLLALAIVLQTLQPWIATSRDGEALMARARDHARTTTTPAYARVIAAGLLWNPILEPVDISAQDAALRKFLRWLEARREAGESVLVLHHQWYAQLLGMPTTWSVDMVRCAIWAGDPMPVGFNEIIRNGSFDVLVLQGSNLEYEWLAGNLAQDIATHYEYVGDLPMDAQLAAPATGAQVAPLAVWRRLRRLPP